MITGTGIYTYISYLQKIPHIALGNLFLKIYFLFGLVSILVLLFLICLTQLLDNKTPLLFTLAYVVDGNKI